MNQEIATQLESTVLAFIGSKIPAEAELRKAVARVAVLVEADQETQDIVFTRLESKLKVKVDVGTAIASTHRPWVLQRAATITPYFWDRYSLFLSTRKRWPATVVSTLGRTTDEILDLCGNPEDPGTWSRRGLVLGEVQSGKTATYTALINKAADAGYKLIILLTGTLEGLRRQTQERLDEGFVGLNSANELRRLASTRLGVGLIDSGRMANVFTSYAGDFDAGAVQNLGLSLTGLREPALFVLKKNANILDNLIEWLAAPNEATPKTKLSIPLLLIDDEADNASLNTKRNGTTAINERIRTILASFSRNSYVGFTATPFANVFVDPDSYSDAIGQDLFPRDFIYSLTAPSNYMGASTIFGGDQRPKTVPSISDGEAVFPKGHKKDLVVTQLPESLWEAVDTFLVANVIRDLRQEGPSHRSMLVNVSVYTDVQNKTEKLILSKLDLIKASIRNFSRLPEADALKDKNIARLYAAWKKHYGDLGFTWSRIQRQLQDSLSMVVTTAVNQSSRNLNYRGQEESGFRVIAVGGNSLSRGLTLEGLMTSYFLRTTAMYDTLLQMGRWFGYRDGYEDLCRIWMTDTAYSWYSHITEATQELRDEIAKMRDQGLTPQDFGLAVRDHPDSLLVTAYNRMRSSESVERIVSVSNRLFESVELSNDEAVRKSNWEAVKRFVAALDPNGIWGTHRSSSPWIRGVPASVVADLVRSFRVAASDLLFQPEDLAEMIKRVPDPKLKEWDVLFPAGTDKRTETIQRFQVPLQRRIVDVTRRAWIVSGDKRRIASRGDESVGLSDTAKATAHAHSVAERLRRDARKGITTDPDFHVSTSDKDYRSQRTAPLLMIHLLQPFDVDEKEEERVPLVNATQPPLCGISLSFCPFNDDTEQKKVIYRLNLVKLRELLGDELDGDDLGDDSEC